MRSKILFAALLSAFSLQPSAFGQTGNNPGIPIFGGPPQTQIAQNYTGTVNPNGVVTAGVGSRYLQQSNIWWFEFVNTNSTISGWSLVLSTTNGQLFAVGTNATLLNGIPGANYAQLTIPVMPTNNGVLDTNTFVELQTAAPDFFSKANPLPIADEEDDFNSLGVVTITSMSNHMMFMVTNGLVQNGLNWIQVSDAVLTNLSGPNPGPTGGNPDYYPPAFPLGGSNFVAMCHSNGIKVFQYVSLNTSGSSSAGNPSFPYPQSIALADKLCTNINVDGVFVEGITVAQDQWQIPVFLSEFIKFGKPIYVHTPGAFTLPGGAGVISTSDLFQPWHNNWINSHYANIDGGPDPTAPNNWTNFITHFKKNLEFGPMTRPGHWIRNYYVYGMADGSPFQRTVFEAAAAEQGGFSYQYTSGAKALASMTNSDFLSLWRDKLMISAPPVSICATNGGLTNWVFAKPIDKVGGTNALAFFLWQTNSPLTLNNTNLGFANPIFTLYSPWSHAVEAYCTNTFTVTGTNQQSFLYQAMSGFVPSIPAFVGGTNYLNNFNFRLNATNGNTASSCGWLRNQFCNATTVELNGVFYSNALAVAGPAYADWPIGQAATNFTCVAGIGDPYAGQAAVQFTFYTNGVQAFQSSWITNANQDTNVSLSMVGVNDLAVFVNGTQNVAPDASWEVGALGSPVVMTPGIVTGTFVGNGDNINFKQPLITSLVVSSNLPTIWPDSRDVDSSFSDTYDNGESEAPFFHVGTVKVTTSSSVGTYQWRVPNWVTNAISTITVQWNGTPTGLLAFTNDFSAFYFPTNAGRVNAGTVSSLVSILHTNLNYIFVTNTWPDTNCTKLVRMLSGSYGALTNNTASVRIWRVNVQASGNGITATNL